MNRRVIITISSILLISTMGFFACVDKNPTFKEKLDTEELTKNQSEVHGNLVKPEDVQLTTPLNQQWVADGKAIYDVKCAACHKLTDERLVGPGWKGVTQQRKPEWILNMITNVDVMLEQDTAAQKLLEECLVRMPNQNLTLEEARKVLEFQRSNDGEK
ncbi:MAG: c-type cytochrome [Flavisolibacter sp.]